MRLKRAENASRSPLFSSQISVRYRLIFAFFSLPYSAVVMPKCVRNRQNKPDKNNVSCLFVKQYFESITAQPGSAGELFSNYISSDYLKEEFSNIE